MVRDTGFEPVTPSVSGRCSTTELTARSEALLRAAKLVSKSHFTQPLFQSKRKNFTHGSLGFRLEFSGRSPQATRTS
jgi:hypothetical protein